MVFESVFIVFIYVVLLAIVKKNVKKIHLFDVVTSHYSFSLMLSLIAFIICLVSLFVLSYQI